MRRLLRAAAGPIFWLAICLFCSCSIATAPAAIEGGKEFPWRDVPTVKEGMTAAEVRQRLGEPFSIEQTDSGTCWLYYYRVRQQDVVRILGVIPRKTTFSHWEREVRLWMADGQVEKMSAVERDLLRG